MKLPSLCPEVPASRPAVRAAGIALTLAALASCGPSGPELPRHDSVLLVTYDTVRADHFGSYGYPLDITPNADSLAERGIVFERVWAPMGMTLPSHATMMSGVSPRVHGALENYYTMSDEVLTLAEHFRAKSYATGGFVGAAVLDQGSGISQGFRKFGQPGFKSDDGSVVSEGLLRRPAREVNNEALAWLDEVHPDRPFFMWVHYFDAHGPFFPPQSSLDLVESGGLVERVLEPRAEEFTDLDLPAQALSGLWTRYAADIHATDTSGLGALLAELGGRGRLDETWVFLTTDHGEGLWEHGERGHGPTVFEEQLRVPLIIASPRGDWAGTRTDEPVHLIDLMPTVIHAASGEEASVGEGVDLLAWLERGAVPLDRALFVERPHYTKKSLVALSTKSKDHYIYGIVTAVIQGNEKFVIGTDGAAELYDLAADPMEHTNLVDERPERAAELRQLLEAHLAENPTLPPGQRPAVSESRRAALEELGYGGGEEDD